MSNMYVQGEFDQGHQAEWKRRVFRFLRKELLESGSLKESGSACVSCFVWGRIHVGRIGYPPASYPVVKSTAHGAVFMSAG